MRDDKLGVRQRAALLALMAEAREVDNKELKEITGFDLTGEFRRQLNDLKLVESTREKNNQPFRHTLTDRGWAWCGEELSVTVPERAGSMGGAMYAVLAGIERFLSRSGMQLHEVFHPAVEELSLDDRIRAVYASLAPEPAAWVSLTELRANLNGDSRSEVDAALHRLSRVEAVSIVPESNQKALTADDRAAAIRIGGEDCHLLSIGER